MGMYGKWVAIPAFVAVTGVLWYEGTRGGSGILRGEDAAEVVAACAERLQAYRTGDSADTYAPYMLHSTPVYWDWGGVQTALREKMVTYRNPVWVDPPLTFQDGDVLVSTSLCGYGFTESSNEDYYGVSFNSSWVSNSVLNVQTMAARHVTPGSDLSMITYGGLNYTTYGQLYEWDPLAWIFYGIPFGFAGFTRPIDASALSYSGGNVWEDAGLGTNVYRFFRERAATNINVVLATIKGVVFSPGLNLAYKTNDFDEARAMARRMKQTVYVDPPFTAPDARTEYRWSLRGGDELDYRGSSFSGVPWSSLPVEAGSLLDLWGATPPYETNTTHSGFNTYLEGYYYGYYGALFNVWLLCDEGSTHTLPFGEDGIEDYSGGYDCEADIQSTEVGALQFEYPCAAAIGSGLVSKVTLYGVFITTCRSQSPGSYSVPEPGEGLSRAMSCEFSCPGVSVLSQANLGMSAVLSPQLELPLAVDCDAGVGWSTYVNNDLTPGPVTSFKLSKLKEWDHPSTYPVTLESGVLGGVSLGALVDRDVALLAKRLRVTRTDTIVGGLFDGMTTVYLDDSLYLDITVHLYRFVMVVDWEFAHLVD